MSDLNVTDVSRNLSLPYSKKGNSSPVSNNNSCTEQCCPLDRDLTSNSVTEVGRKVGRAIYSFAARFVGIFNPFMDFVNDIINVEEGENTSDESIKYLKSIFNGINANIEKDEVLKNNISPAAKDALRTVSESLSGLGDDSISNDRLAQIISNWSSNRDTRQLLEIAQMIRNGQCANKTPQELRRLFIESLESLAQAIDDARTHPPSPDRDQAISGLVNGADSTINGIQRARQASNNGGLTQSDHTYIVNQLDRARDSVNSVVSNPSLSRFLSSSTLDRLRQWVEDAEEYIVEWYRELKKQEEIENEKKCEERDNQVAEFKKLCRRYKVAKHQYEECLRLKEVAKRKKEEYLGILETLRRNLWFNGSNTNNARNQVKRFNSTYNYAESKSNEHSLNARYIKNLQNDLASHAPPSHVCHGISGYINLDFVC